MFDYDKFYKTQSVNMNSDPTRFSRVASLCTGKVLDIGCCMGVLADYYFDDYTGLDFSEEALKRAEAIRREDAKFMLRDCSDLTDFDFSSYDTIVITEFLEHFENDEKILDPIFATAKPGTRLIITCPNGPRIPDPSHVRELTIPELRKRFSPHGKVKFYNWPGAYSQILMTCDLGQKNDDLVSLVMIVKDEEKGLEKAIFSCLDFVDNIVISIDSKSTDKTLEIAKLYADTLKTHVFEDDFSKARNDAHQGVKTKWIFFLDGHEIVVKKDNLEKYLSFSEDGLLVPVKLENGFTFPNPRFYKNGVHFEGKIHEKQMCKSTRFYPNFLIEHHRIGTQSSQAVAFRKRQRDDMVPRIMGAELKQNPKNARALFHLGCFYQSREEYKKALSCFSKYLRYSKNKQERWFVLFQSSLCCLVQGKLFRAFHFASLAEYEISNRWEISKLKGMIFLRKGKHAKALEYFIDSFKDDKGVLLYRPWKRELSQTWNWVGECFFGVKNFEKAFYAFSRSAQTCEDEDAKKFLEKRAKLMYDIFRDSLKPH